VEYQHKEGHKKKRISLERVATLGGQKEVDHFRVTTLKGKKKWIILK
jgi:hypothetical protein